MPKEIFESIQSDGLSPTGVVSSFSYATVAASQTQSSVGSRTGDILEGILVVPATTSPGNVIVVDGATSITVFTGGASSVGSLVPFYIPLGLKSTAGGFAITTGANVSVVVTGHWA